MHSLSVLMSPKKTTAQLLAEKKVDLITSSEVFTSTSWQSENGFQDITVLKHNAIWFIHVHRGIHQRRLRENHNWKICLRGRHSLYTCEILCSETLTLAQEELPPSNNILLPRGAIESSLPSKSLQHYRQDNPSGTDAIFYRKPSATLRSKQPCKMAWDKSAPIPGVQTKTKDFQIKTKRLLSNYLLDCIFILH